MELRYCEMCGEIIKVQKDEEGLDPERHLCGRCSAKQSDATPKSKPKAEDVSLRPSTKQLGAADRAPKEISLDGLLASHQLDLYSADTLARHKESTKEMRPVGGTSAARSLTKIRLLDPDDPEPAVTGARAPTATVTREAQARPSSARVSSEGTVPFKFPCPMCRVKLAVPPVAKESRMTCPRCKTKMTIAPDRTVRVIEGSAGVKKTATPGPGSTRVSRSAKPDLLGSALLTSHPDASGVQPCDSAFAPTERLITCQNTQILGAMHDPLSCVPPPPSAVAPPMTPAHATAAFTAPSPADVTADAQRTAAAFQEYAATPRALLKALGLGILLSAPFYTWGLLLYLADTQAPFGAYLEALGDAFRAALDALILNQ